MKQNIKNKMKKLCFNRVLLVGFIIAVQVVWFIEFLWNLTEYYWWIDLLLSALSVLALLVVVNRRDNPAYKLAWSVLILTLPLFGGLMYLSFGNKKPQKKLHNKLDHAWKTLSKELIQDEKIMEEVGSLSKTMKGQSVYLSQKVGFPIYKNTQTTYFSSGEENFPFMKQALEKAEHFIFMEYFIIDDGVMWSEILEILKKKAKQGIDVRLMYDDVGSLTMLPYGYYKTLEYYGIRCEAFNPFVPFVSIVMNNRDHRKIMVIDGHTGFTGGINLADEYINQKNRFGYWKDTGIMLVGEAVRSLTVMFLSMWNAVRLTDVDYSDFMPHRYHKEEFPTDGYVQPYGDSPLDNETVGENVYLNIINTAVDYLYLFTPYLIVDNEMMTAICLAAKRGVDIRIVTPHVPDKKMIFTLTQSYYGQMIDAGVKIYQFKPGFIHAKCFVCDDKVAVVGTVNMDYRSLYLHFECGVLLFNTSSVLKVKEDAQETIKQSILITKEMTVKSLPVHIVQAILRLFAPLL